MASGRFWDDLPNPAVDLVREPGCPVCHAANERRRAYLSWFASDNYADPGTLQRVRDSLGWCDVHTRDVLELPDAELILPSVWIVVLTGLRPRLAKSGRSGSNPPTVPACPICASEQAGAELAITTLIEANGHPTVRRRLAARSPLCLPHLRLAMREHAEATSRYLIPWCQRALAERPALVLGIDPDALRRTRLHRSLPEGDLWEDLAARRCPICAGALRAELAVTQRTDGALCRRHLCEQSVEEGAQAPARLDPGQLGDSHCVRCAAGRREEAMLVGKLDRVASDTGRRDPSLPGACLCLRHVASTAAGGHELGRLAVPAAARALSAMLVALHEAIYKRSVDNHRPLTTTERDAWRDVPARLDGRVLLG